MTSWYRLDFTLVPTFTIYEANRDVARARDAEWHERVHLAASASASISRIPACMVRITSTGPRRTKSPGGTISGCGCSLLTTTKTMAAGLLQVLMPVSSSNFLVSPISASWSCLQEAGFHPLEVVQAATANGARLVGLEDEIGSLVPGKKADIVLVAENPLQNFKVLYGTGHMKLNRNRRARAGGRRQLHDSRRYRI